MLLLYWVNFAGLPYQIPPFMFLYVRTYLISTDLRLSEYATLVACLIYPFELGNSRITCCLETLF